MLPLSHIPTENSKLRDEKGLQGRRQRGRAGTARPPAGVFKSVAGSLAILLAVASLVTAACELGVVGPLHGLWPAGDGGETTPPGEVPGDDGSWSPDDPSSEVGPDWGQAGAPDQILFEEYDAWLRFRSVAPQSEDHAWAWADRRYAQNAVGRKVRVLAARRFGSANSWYGAVVASPGMGADMHGMVAAVINARGRFAIYEYRVERHFLTKTAGWHPLVDPDYHGALPVYDGTGQSRRPVEICVEVDSAGVVSLAFDGEHAASVRVPSLADGMVAGLYASVTAREATEFPDVPSDIAYRVVEPYMSP